MVAILGNRGRFLNTSRLIGTNISLDFPKAIECIGLKEAGHLDLIAKRHLGLLGSAVLAAIAFRNH
jgi:hypothetical protein